MYLWKIKTQGERFSMSELVKDVIDRFSAYCREVNLGVGTMATARSFVVQEVCDFEEQERSIGLAKTRRPDFGRRFFEEQIARAIEIERRRKEEVNRLFGQD